VSIKVPVDRFDDLLQHLPADSDQLMDKKVSSQDVSLETVDTKARLETKKEVRDRYLDLLHQAGKMKDILSIQQEIDAVQEDMDAAASRVAYLSHSAALSTINLKFSQVLETAPVDIPEPSFFHQIKTALVDGWESVSAILLALVTVWPLWLVIGFGWGIWRRHRPKAVASAAQ
jgi:hypothetical protein